MVDHRIKDLSGNSRRTFLKFASAVGAGLAVSQTEVLNYIADVGGHAMADECIGRNRMVSLIAGDGGFAWFQLLWPHNGVAKSGNNNAAFHALGQAVDAPDTDKPQVWAPETPWQSLGKNRRMTAMMAGTNQTHTPTPSSPVDVGGGINVLAAAAAMHQSLPSLLPVIGVRPFDFGNAPGAPQVTTVGNPEDMVGLFDSAASKAVLAANSDAANYEAYYKAFLGLNKVAGRATFQRQLRISKASANFLGKNLASLLRPRDEDLVRYGINGGTPNKLTNIAYTLLTAVNAFKMGLTNGIIMPCLRDDPHGAFADMQNLQMTVGTLGRILDEFMKDLESFKDPVCSTKTLADTTVMTIHGDTPKDPNDRSGWPDGTPGNSNWVYVYGAGHLKTGWFGGIGANGGVSGFDPKTGENVPGMTSAQTTNAANAAILYAVTQGDKVAIQQFTAQSIGGVIHEKLQ
jgi:hypothetical protein